MKPPARIAGNSPGPAPPRRELPRTGSAEPTAGLVQPPWYFHPPVSPFNGGPFSAPGFEKWNQERGNPVVVTGWEAERLRADPPDIFFISDLELRDLVRLEDRAAIEFRSTLSRTYEKQRVFLRPPPPFSWLSPPRSWVPPDWRYVDPVIKMYYQPRPAEERR